jgi:hypothetical protein
MIRIKDAIFIFIDVPGGLGLGHTYRTSEEMGSYCVVMI